MASQGKAGGNKLFKLKKWVTLPEAARYLSLLFGEEVNEAEVLSLALDDNLKLSVNILHGTFAKPCLGTTTDLKEFQVKKGESYTLGTILKAEDNVVNLTGIYDLPMIGAEKNDIKLKWQQLISDSMGEYINLQETVVEGQDGKLYLLQKIYFNEPQMNSVDDDSTNELNFLSSYGPANGLPEDSILVVRTSALHELEERLAAEEPGEEKQQSEKEEKTNLHIIAALLQIIKSNKIFQTEGDLRAHIAVQYDGVSGCAERTLAGRFSKAKKLIAEAFSK